MITTYRRGDIKPTRTRTTRCSNFVAFCLLASCSSSSSSSTAATGTHARESSFQKRAADSHGCVHLHDTSILLPCASPAFVFVLSKRFFTPKVWFTISRFTMSRCIKRPFGFGSRDSSHCFQRLKSPPASTHQTQQCNNTLYCAVYPPLDRERQRRLIETRLQLPLSSSAAPCTASSQETGSSHHPNPTIVAVERWLPAPGKPRPGESAFNALSLFPGETADCVVSWLSLWSRDAKRPVKDMSILRLQPFQSM